MGRTLVVCDKFDVPVYTADYPVFNPEVETDVRAAAEALGYSVVVAEHFPVGTLLYVLTDVEE